MKYPDFFDSIEAIKVKDGLAQFLGAVEDGVMEFKYLDLVKTAGHSCGTVSGAYLTAMKGLKALYGEELPVRGEIKVEIKKTPTENNAGVVGNVLSNITGATTDFGFGGLPNGKFNRRNLLFFGADIETDVRFTRTDTGKQVGVNYRPGKVVNPKEIMMLVFGPEATEESKATFPAKFQNMVKTIFENADEVFEVVEY